MRSEIHSTGTPTLFDLISEHTLISGYPPFLFIFLYFFCILIIISSDFREGNTNLLYTGLMVTMVKTIARAHRGICVLAVFLCCIMLLCGIMQSIFDAN